jgi:hypothetical protein
MKRAMALYNLAKIIVDQCIDERGDRIDLIEYVSGKRPALSTLSNAEIADQLEFVTGDENVQVTGGKVPDPIRPIDLPLSRHEAILLSSLILARSEPLASTIARSEPLASTIARTVYPDTEAGHFAKYCDVRYLTELREMTDRIDERIRELDVVKKQQYAQEGLTDTDD